MTATQLMTDLARLGIHIEAHGDRLRYSPRSAVTPGLADRMKANKPELLAMLRTNTQGAEPWTVRCPWCTGTALMDTDAGLKCEDCGKMAWIDLFDSGTVRADHSDDDLVVIDPPPIQPWQRWEANCGCGVRYRTATLTRQKTLRVTCASCRAVLGERPLAELQVASPQIRR